MDLLFFHFSEICSTRDEPQILGLRVRPPQKQRRKKKADAPLRMTNLKTTACGVPRGAPFQGCDSKKQALLNASHGIILT
jgi:hypothetical protein